MEINETFDSIQKQIAFFDSVLGARQRIQISFPNMTNATPMLLTHFWCESPDLFCFYASDSKSPSLVVSSSNNIQFILEQKHTTEHDCRIIFKKP